MAYPVSTIRTEKGKHRLHEPFFMISVVCTSITMAFVGRLIKNVDLQKAGTSSFQCVQMDRYVTFPSEALDRALTNTIPDSLEISIDAQPGGAGGIWPIQEILTTATIPMFVEFYEDYRPWLAANINSDFTKWSNVWQFARIVRNAASHSGIHINDQTFVPITWYKLTYGPSQHGRKIFGPDLAPADIAILMLEMNDALDQLGCPISP